MNIQPIEKRDRTADGTLDVHSVFQTIQGEGPFCGTPCVFIRLAGCNLQCPACDTEYTAGRRRMAVADLVHEVFDADTMPQRHGKLVVITGGEPFRQDLRGLLAQLAEHGYNVQIETNGTLPPADWDYIRYVSTAHVRHPDSAGNVYVVCSPKTPQVHPDILRAACALKYVVRAGMVAEDGLPLSALDMPNPPARPPQNWDRPVYVQPLDSGDAVENAAHANEAVASCLRHGYTLQVQVHKLVGVE